MRRNVCRWAVVATMSILAYATAAQGPENEDPAIIALTTSRDIEQAYDRLLANDRLTEDVAPEFFTKLAESLLQRFTLESVRTISSSIQPTIEKTKDLIDDFKTQFQ